MPGLKPEFKKYYQKLMVENPDRQDDIRRGAAEIHKTAHPVIFPTLDELSSKGQEYRVAQQPGYAKTFAQGVGRGVEGLAGGVGSVTRWAGDVVGSETLSGIGKETSDYWKRAADTGWEKRDTDTFQGTFLENPSVKRAIGIVGEAAPSMAVGLATGGSAALGLKALGAGAKTIATAAPAIAGTALGTLEGAGTYEEAREKGKGVGEASVYGGLTTIATAALEATGIGKILGAKGSPIRGAITGAIAEGGTEAAQTFTQNLIAKYGYDNTRKWHQGIVESIIGGAGLGGPAGAISTQIDVSSPKIQEALAEGMAPEDVAGVIESTQADLANATEEITASTPQDMFESGKISEEVEPSTSPAGNVLTATPDTVAPYFGEKTERQLFMAQPMQGGILPAEASAGAFEQQFKREDQAQQYMEDLRQSPQGAELLSNQLEGERIAGQEWLEQPIQSGITPAEESAGVFEAEERKRKRLVGMTQAEQMAESRQKMSEPMKPKKQAKKTGARTIRGVIKSNGGINFGNMKGELRDMPVAVKRITKTDGIPIDLMEKSLVEEGWLNPGESLIDSLRDDPQFLRRRHLSEDIAEKTQADKTQADIKLEEQIAFEPEEPPMGDYKKAFADELRQDEELTLIHGKGSQGWGKYKVDIQPNGDVSLVGHETIELTPFDDVEILQAEKRTDIEKRKRVSEMSPEELKTELLIDYKTGLGNQRAYDEAPKKKFYTSVDVDGLKWVNDNIGHDAGDALIRNVGEAFKQEGLDSYHQSGDEYSAQSNSQEKLDSAMENADKYLRENPIEVVLPDGTQKYFTGSFSYGTAETIKEAEQALGKQKREREVSGERYVRGAEPKRFLKERTEGNEDQGRGQAGEDVVDIQSDIEKVIKPKTEPKVQYSTEDIKKPVSKPKTLMNKWRKKGHKLDIFENDNSITVQTIVIKEEDRKKGVGSEIMQDIARYADKKGKRIELTPALKDDFHGTTSRSRLKKFYKRFSFVENKGRNKDFTINADRMYREPKVKYSTGATIPSKPVTRETLQALPYVTNVTGKEGKYRLHFKNNISIPLKTVKLTDEGAYVFTPQGKKLIRGKFTQGQGIEITQAGDIRTAVHENLHFFESIGLLSPKDIRLLNRAGEKMFPGEDDKTESRAKYFESVSKTSKPDSLVGKIYEKIKDFVIQMRQVFGRTVGGVIKDIETGKVFDKKAGPGQLTTETQYSTEETKEPNFKDTTTDVTEDDYVKAFKDSKNIKGNTASNLRKFKADVQKGLDKYLGSLSTRLGNINPKLKAKVRKLSFDTDKKSSEDMQKVQPMLMKVKKNMTPEDMSAWDYARKNSQMPKINELIEKYGLQNEYKAYRDTLDKIRDEAIDVGLDVGYIEEYAPRILKDSKGFLEAIGKEGDWPVISRRLKERAEAMGMDVTELNADQKADIISGMIHGGSYGLGGVPATKERKLKKIPAELNKFYMDSDGALVSHIHSMRKAIEARKFFGKVPDIISKTKTKLNAAQKEIATFDATTEKRNKEILLKIDNLESKKSLTDKEHADLKRLNNALLYFQKSRSERLQDLKDNLYEYEQKINRYKNQRDFSENIGTYVNDLIEKGEISGKDEQDLIEMLTARFNEAGTRGIVQAYKNISYIDTMGSPTSAITQIGDLAFSAYEAGIIPALKNAYKSARGQSRITKEDVGIERIAQEFADSGTLGNAVSKVFWAVGLEKMDTIGKESLLNSALEKYQKQADKNPGKLKDDIKNIFEDETDSVISDLQNNEITDNVKLLVYNRLLDFQPAAISEMPQKYLTAGNGRIFYMLKSFTLKQFDVYRNEVYKGLKSKDPKKKIDAMKNFVRLSSLFVLANAGADELKDFLLGRKTDLDDRVVDNILKLGGISKYVTWKARTEGVGSAAVKQILPPFKFIDAVTKDIMKAGDEKGLESLASLPVAGKLAYWHMGRGVSKRGDLWNRRLLKKKNKLKDIKEGFDESESKQEYAKKYRTELADYRKIKRFQTSINRIKKRVNRLKKLEQTDARKKLISELELKRTEMIKTFLKD